MANNRLFIGNKETKEYMFLEKGWGAGWDGGWLNTDRLQEFLSTQWNDGGLGAKTNLILFSEHDDCWEDFMENGIKFE